MSDSTFIDLTLNESTTLSDVIAATIQDIPVNHDSNSFDLYLDNSESTANVSTANHPPEGATVCQTFNTAYLTPHKYDASQLTTPNAKSTPVNYFSPGGDSRFNDSLSGLLGSPPADSPLAKNPFFSQLQAVLADECKVSESLPESLIATIPSKPHQDVFTREQQLQQRFTLLSDQFPDDIKQLANFFRYQAAVVETDRFNNCRLVTEEVG